MESYGEYTDKGKSKRYKLIDVEHDAYLIGYLACDGGYIGSARYPFMMVNGTDERTIRWMQRVYLPDKVIYNSGKKSSAKVNAINDCFELRWSSSTSQQFSKYGIMCRKKDRRVVSIPNKVFLEYLAGCIDADGFISVTHRKDCRTPRLRFFITHASELFLADLQSRIQVNTTLRQHGDNVWRLQGQNTEQNKPFMSEVLPFLRNSKKKGILTNYLNEYYVPQELDELLETPPTNK